MKGTEDNTKTQEDKQRDDTACSGIGGTSSGKMTVVLKALCSSRAIPIRMRCELSQNQSRQL